MVETKKMYLGDMLKNGVITKEESGAICDMIDKTDSIVTFEANKFIVSDRETTFEFDDKKSLMCHVFETVYYANKKPESVRRIPLSNLSDRQKAELILNNERLRNMLFCDVYDDHMHEIEESLEYLNCVYNIEMNSEDVDNVRPCPDNHVMIVRDSTEYYNTNTKKQAIDFNVLDMWFDKYRNSDIGVMSHNVETAYHDIMDCHALFMLFDDLLVETKRYTDMNVALMESLLDRLDTLIYRLEVALLEAIENHFIEISYMDMIPVFNDLYCYGYSGYYVLDLDEDHHIYQNDIIA